MGTIALDARLTAVHDYWRRKRGDRPMPARKDIDPVDIPKLLGDVKILERVGDRLRFRLVGSAIATAYGRDPTGKFLDEVLERDRDEFTIKSYMSVLEAGRPAVSRGKVSTAHDAGGLRRRKLDTTHPVPYLRLSPERGRSSVG